METAGRLIPFQVHEEYRKQSSPEMHLYKLQDGRLQVVTEGRLPMLLCGPFYILAQNKLALFLQACSIPNFSTKPAEVFRRADGKRWQSHYELIVNDELFPGSISSVDARGYRLWHFRSSHLFVSPELRDRLMSDFPELQYSPGFRGFYGIPSDELERGE